ncbi:MAG TPA: hypothetical protein VN944_12690 [Nitrospiria bacterium]|nr:hypothetical protein [Nitrospiria bacterium]
MKKCLILSVILLLFLESRGQSASNPDQIIVIVSNQSAIKQLTKTDLRNIYLGETKEWDDGSPVQPLDLGEGNQIRGMFCQIYLKKSLSSLKYYWVEKVFTGRGAPPLVLESEQKIKEFIASHPGAIGYIRLKHLDSTVRRIDVRSGK